MQRAPALHQRYVQGLLNAPVPRAGLGLLPESLRREIVRSSPVRPALYWLDLLTSAGIGWATFLGALAFSPLSLPYGLLSGVAVLAFLRAAYFIHELGHRTEQELPGFALAWHLLVGIPILVPAFMMWPHREHHALSGYGTASDPEFAPVPSWGRMRLLGAVAIYAVVPIMLAARFAFAPIGMVVRRARVHAITKVSTADIDHLYERPPIAPEDRRRFLLQEGACFLFAWVAIGATALGWLPLALHLHRWAVMAVALLVNHARLLVIHRYEGDWSPRSLDAQTLDTYTLGPESPLTELIAPVGSRFHALHHELPSVPYHALPAAHQRAMAALPADHPYRRTVSPGFFARWGELLERAKEPQEPNPRPTGIGSATGRQ